jgi:NAD(P)-dependent dehydrogenase (short-subunit alcohol dehydrogenase family)
MAAPFGFFEGRDMSGRRIEGVAVVTGGASGIGAACCRVLAEAGATAVVLDRDEGHANAVAAEITGKAWVADVGDENAIDACAGAIEAALGPVNVLVNSAGVIQIPLPPEELPMSSWDDVVRIDQRGTYVASVAFGRRMATRGRGSIINIASIAGMRSMPLHAYAPAKAAVIAMTECLAAEWGRSGVRVNAVSPGYTRTPALQAAIDRGERDVSALNDNSALGRMVNPEEIARAVCFLASEDASAITGINLPVDCGWLVAPPWHTYGGIRLARR